MKKSRKCYLILGIVSIISLIFFYFNILWLQVLLMIIAVGFYLEALKNAIIEEILDAFEDEELTGDATEHIVFPAYKDEDIITRRK